MVTILQVGKKNYFRSAHNIPKEIASKRSIMEKLLFFRGGQSAQIANLQILGFIPLLQIRKFLRCVNLQISNPQIFITIRKSANLYQTLHNSVSKQFYISSL
jgi:hypothetical protein